MPDDVAVETNWILDVALARDASSEHMWELARQDNLTIYLPSMCLAESVKTIESQFRAWHRLVGELKNASSEARRSRVLASLIAPLQAAQVTLTNLEDTAEVRFWEVLAQITGRVSLLETTAEAISRAGNVRGLLGLSPADSLVLATLIEAQTRGASREFMSRDQKAFDSPEVRRYLEGFGMTYHANPRSFLRATRRRPR